MSRLLAAGLAAAVVFGIIGSVGPASAATHEQIVLSGEANGTFDGVQTDVGFSLGDRQRSRWSALHPLRPILNTRHPHGDPGATSRGLTPRRTCR